MNSRCYQEMSIVVRKSIQYDHGMGTPPGQEVSPIINPVQAVTKKAGRIAVLLRRFPDILRSPRRPDPIEHSLFLRPLTRCQRSGTRSTRATTADNVAQVRRPENFTGKIPSYQAFPGCRERIPDGSGTWLSSRLWKRLPVAKATIAALFENHPQGIAPGRVKAGSVPRMDNIGPRPGPQSVLCSRSPGAS